MSRWKRPLKAAEVRKILRALGFEPKPLKATSHEQWTKRDGESFYKGINWGQIPIVFDVQGVCGFFACFWGLLCPETGQLRRQRRFQSVL